MDRQRFDAPGVVAVNPIPATPARVSVLGGFRLVRGDREIALQEGPQRLVAFLALAPDRGATRRALIAGLWPDAADDHSRAALRSTLYRIRQAAPGFVRVDGQRVSLDPSVTVDLDGLRAVIRAALEAPGEVDKDEVDMLTGATDLLADWDDDWIEVERERVHEVRLQALERLAEHLTERGMAGAAVEAGLAAVADEPFRESAHRVLIEAYVRTGNVAAAMDRFRRLRQRLRRELGVRPSAELTARMRRLQRDQSPGQGDPDR